MGLIIPVRNLTDESLYSIRAWVDFPHIRHASKERLSVRSNADGAYQSQRFDVADEGTNQRNAIFREVSECLAPSLPTGLEMSQLWVNYNPPGSWNMPHVHVPYPYSGAACIQNDGPGGDFIAINSNPWASFEGSGSPIESVQFRPGQVLLFRGSQLHMVTPNRSDQERITIGFNLQWQKGNETE